VSKTGILTVKARDSRLKPRGETRDVHHAGGRYITLVGSNSRFHQPQDRWPETVNVEAVARIASAAARIVLALTR
jgi:hypothetical protein